MKYAILGSGNVGTTIARAVTAAGHDVVVSDVDEAALASLTDQVPDATTTTDAAQATADADVAVLAVPFEVVEDLVSGLAGELADTVVIDATNPLAADLSAARYLEGMAYLNIARNARNDLPWKSGWKLVGPVA